MKIDETLEYFEGDELAYNVFYQKYALRDNNGDLLEKTPKDMFVRISREFARIEQKKYKNGSILKPLSESEIFDLMYNMYIIPQGSPLFGIGNKYQSVSLANCFVMHSPEDSYGSIMRTDEELVQLSKRRGGVGTDLSNLRPAGHPTRNAAKTSTGMATFMERFSNSINEVGQCIAKGEQVITKRGIINIEDVIPNQDYVWTKEGWVNVLNVFSNGKKEIRKITTKYGYTIKTSKDHLFQTSDSKGNLTETRIVDMFVGDELVMCLGEPDNENSKYVELDNKLYEKYDNNKVPEGNIPNILDESLSYLIGYLYGNGSTDENRSLKIAVPDNKPNILTKLVNIIRDKFQINVVVSEGDGACKVIYIHNKRIVDFLRINNILKEKSKYIKVPNNILMSNKDVQLAFVSGYFDADGNATNPKKSGYRVASISHNFLKTIQMILSSNGVVSKISKEDRSHKENWYDLYTLRVVGTHSQTELLKYCVESLKIQESCFVSKRDCIISPYYAKNIKVKSNKYSYCCGENLLSLGCLDKLQKDGIACSARLFNDKIVSIEVGDEFEETFDLELESEHLFWCNGFYVHNSSRRGALMLSIDVKHPDIMEFITIKNDRTKVTGANISVKLTDEFMSAVDKDDDFELCFPIDWKEKGLQGPTISKIVRAREIFNAIVNNAHQHAEPGVLFWDTIIKNSPADCYSKFGYKTTSTNPCTVGNTLVLTNYGWVRFKNLESLKSKYNDLKIFTSDKDFQITLSELEWVGITKENDDIFEIEFENGQKLKCNRTHKFYLKGSYKEIEVQNAIVGETEVYCKDGFSKIIKILDLNYKEDVYDLTANPNYNFYAVSDELDEILLDTPKDNFEDYFGKISINDKYVFSLYDKIQTNNGIKYVIQLNNDDEIKID